MTINNNNVEQINVALLDLEKKIKNIKSSNELEALQAQVDQINKNLRETRSGLQSGETYNINISGNAATATKAISADTAATATTAGTANSATNDSDGNKITDTYVKKAGDEMTGTLTFPASKYKADGGAINLRNSDVLNANSIYFADESTNSEGLMFPNGDNFDEVKARGGHLYFRPNSGTEYEVPYIIKSLVSAAASGTTAQGYIKLGSLLIKYGQRGGSGTSGTVTFNTTYPFKNPPIVIVCDNSGTSSSTDTEGVDFGPLVSDVKAASFRVSVASNRGLTWIAIGEANS